MSLEPVTAGIDLVTAIVSRVWPDKTEHDKAILSAALAQDANFTAMMTAQMAVNEAEVATGNVYLGGWRSAVGWICAASFAWQFIVLQILLYIGSAVGHPIAVPAFDMASMLTVLMGMLGLGSLHTYEKIKGVN